MLNDLWIRLRALFQRDAVEVELDDELRFHVARQIEKYVRSGMSRDEAQRRVRLEFGGVDQVKEECREARGIHFLEILAQDVRYGVRMLAKNWKPASIAGLSLAIAMTLNVAALGIIDGVLLRSPLATDPQRLLTVYTSTPSTEIEGVSYPDYKYFRDNNRSFSDIAAFPNDISKTRLIHGDRKELGTVEQTSDNYFSVMGIRPFLGRFFTPQDDDKKTASAVLSYSCWKRWGADPDIAGKTVILGKDVIPIVGVAPKSFTGVVFGFNADVILNLGTNGLSPQGLQILADRNNRWLFPVGRLKPGVTQPSARSDLTAMSAQLASAYPTVDKDRVALPASTTVMPPDSRSSARLISGILIGVVLMVLMIACANVANLLLGLATGRKQEILIRSALGATRARLIRQLLTESFILCGAGGIAGLIVASVVLARFSRFNTSLPIAGTLDIATNFHTDGLVLATTLLLIFVASLAAGITPALYASEPNVAGALSGEAVAGGRRKNFIRNALVIVQITVCTLVIAGVGLCLRSLSNLRYVNKGFSARNLVVVMMNLEPDGFSEAQGRQLYDRLRQSASQLYGVESNSLAVDFPLLNDAWTSSEIAIQGFSDGARQHEQIPGTVVDGNYFETLGLPFLAGRTFNSFDAQDDPEVLIINHKMAETYWPGENPIGKQVRTAESKRLATIVGVVADAKYNALDESLHPVIYYPLSQHYSSGIILIARTKGDPQRWQGALSQAVRKLGVTVDVQPFTLDDAVHLTLLFPFLTLIAAAALGALALMLAILGLYGSIFYSVNERRKEIGIRAALGAHPSDLIAMFLRQTAVISGIGIAMGSLLGVVATILLKTQFYGISAVEIPVLIPTAMGMMAICVAITYAATLPWIKINPLDAIRHS